MSDRFIRTAAAITVILIAVLAGVVSYAHIYELAHDHGQSGIAARLLPLSVDGTILAASLVLLHAARRRLSMPVLGRSMLIVGVAATVLANIAYGIPYGPIGAVVSAWPAAAFVGCAEMALGMVRSSRRAEDAPKPEDGPMPSVHRIFAKEIAARTVPSIRVIKTAMACGQDRASQVQAYLTLLAGN